VLLIWILKKRRNNSCWNSSITERDRKMLDKVIKKSSSVLGCSLDSVREVGDRRALAKLTAMLAHKSHPLHYTLSVLQSSFSDRLLHPCCVREKCCRSFLPDCTMNMTLCYI